MTTAANAFELKSVALFNAVKEQFKSHNDQEYEMSGKITRKVCLIAADAGFHFNPGQPLDKLKQVFARHVLDLDPQHEQIKTLAKTLGLNKMTKEGLQAIANH